MSNIKLIDIHTHLIPNVDDGVKTLTESIKIIKDMIKQGVKEIVLTPHKQSTRSKGTINDIKAGYEELQNEVTELGLDIKLHLGYEIRYYTHLKPNYNNLVLNETKYLFLEFDNDYDPSIIEVVSKLISMGFKVVIAHIERYKYLKYDDIKTLKNIGALIQVNAKTIYEPRSLKERRFVRKLLKDKNIDFIASDVHNDSSRNSNLSIAYNHLSSKLDSEYLNKIFYSNAYNMIYS